MIVAGGVLLLSDAAADFLVGPVLLLRRVPKDPRLWDDRGWSTPFLRGHVVLIVVGALLDICSLSGG